MSQKEQQQGGSAHPLFQMNIDTEDNYYPASQEKAEEIDKAVESFLEDTTGDTVEEVADQETKTETTTTVESGISDTEGYSQHALVAKSYQEQGKIPKEVEIVKDLSADAMIDLLVAAKTGQQTQDAETWERERMESVKARLEAEGVSKKDFELLAHLKQGGRGEVVSRYHELNQWATDKAETEEDMLETIRFAAELAGQKKEYVDSYIANNLTESAEIQKAFEEAQASIAVIAERELEADKERVRNETKAREDQWTAFEANVKATVSKGVKGITFSKADQEDIINFMTKKSVIKDVIVNGQKVRKTMTPYQEFGRRLQTDIEENVLFAYYGMKGSVGLINAANKAANDKFLDAALSAASKPGTGKGTVSQTIEDSEGELITAIGFG